MVHECNQEIFKDISWFEWLYQVSNYWNVKSIWKYKSCKNWLLKKSWNYEWVSLCKNWLTKRYTLHRLVAQAFLWLDIKDFKSIVMHLDDNPYNNNVNNLKIWTQKENIIDCANKWRLNQSIWEQRYNCKITDVNVKKLISTYLEWWYTQIILWKKYWIWQDQVSRLINKKRREYLFKNN